MYFKVVYMYSEYDQEFCTMNMHTQNDADDHGWQFRLVEVSLSFGVAASVQCSYYANSPLNDYKSNAAYSAGNLTALILELITSDTTDWYCVTSGQSLVLWNL